MNVESRDELVADSRCEDGEQLIMTVSSEEEEQLAQVKASSPKQKEKKKKSKKKKDRKKVLKEAALNYEIRQNLEKNASNDSGMFQDFSCGNCISSLFKLNPDTIVVNVEAYTRPWDCEKDETDICEPMPLKGTPELIIVGTVMSKTLEHCPVQHGDRVMAFLPVEYESETLANVPFELLIPMKKNLEPWQQVSIALSYLPALQILQSAPFTVEGNKVLLNGGMGPVNQALTHLCILHGAKKVYVPVEHHLSGYVRGFGARPVGPKHSDWSRLLIDKIDVVVDGIGENNFVTSGAMLVDSGHMIVTGTKDLDGRTDEFFHSLTRMMVDMRLKGSDRTTIFDFAESLDNSAKYNHEAFLKDFKYLDKLVWEGTLPTINTEITLDEYKAGRKPTSIYSGYDIITIPPEEFAGEE